jgi:hypothetical protein
MRSMSYLAVAFTALTLTGCAVQPYGYPAYPGGYGFQPYGNVIYPRYYSVQPNIVIVPHPTMHGWRNPGLMERGWHPERNAKHS